MEKVPKHPSDLHYPVRQLRKSGFSSEYLKMQSMGVSVPLTQLIGREHEVEVVCDLLKRPEVRLLTLTGPGGVGKTRLARHVLADVQRVFADGYGFVALAPINDPPLVMTEIHRALRLRQVGSVSFLIQLQDFLEEKQFLLVLDNLEQVVKVAPMLLELLSSCTGLKLLVTSRSILGVQGEYEFVVPPLALPDMKHLPDSETLSHVESVALFVQRAQTVKHDFQVNDANASMIATICTRLDGLPLAIELAAARIKLLSSTALLARLERRLQVLTGGGPDLPERHHTLSDTIKWSYDLLTSDEQLLFRHLSVFVGGCTLETIETFSVLIGEMNISVLDGVTSLQDKSLLQRVDQEGEETRLQMLETVREYGLEELAANGELDRIRDAHAAYFQAFVQKAELTLWRMSQGPMPTQLEREYANVKLALEWSMEQGRGGEAIEMTLQLAAALGQIWINRGELSEGRSILERALAASRETTSPVSLHSQANALFVAGSLAYWQYEFEHASRLLEEGLMLFQMLGDRRGTVASLNRLGNIQHHLGNIEAGDAMLEVVLKLCRQSADREGMADNLVIQGTAAFYRGEFYRAHAYCEESLALYVELGDTFGSALNLLTLGWIAYCQGEYVNAHRLTEESIEQFRILGHSGFKLEARTFLAFTEAALGEVAKASKMLEEVLVRGREQGHQDVIAQALWALGQLALKQNNLRRASTLFREGLASMTGRMIPLRFKWITAACLEGLGEIALVQGQPAWTTWLYGAADAFRTVQDYCNPLGIEQPNYEHTLAEARRQLGEENFVALRDEGKRMSPEQALEAGGRTSLLKQASKEIIAPTGAKHQLVVSSPSSKLPELLTVREIDVIRLVAEGLTNKQIAERLVISPSTVDTHIQSIYNRLGISSRSAATRYAIEHHLL